MTRQILKTRWRDVPYKEIEKYLIQKVKDNGDRWNRFKGTEVEIFIPPMPEAKVGQTHSCVEYELVKYPSFTVCPHLVEIGD